MSPFSRLLASGTAAHGADQLAVAALPLTAVLMLEAEPALVGTLVAIQGLAWLLVSLPAGVLVDRWPKGRVIAFSQGLAALALLVAAAGASVGTAGLLASALFVAGSGAVVLVLAALALIPDLVTGRDLARANARLELARAAATMAAPVLVGFLAERSGPTLGFLLAAAASGVAAALALSLKVPGSAPASAKPTLSRGIVEGAAFAVRNELLRGIALCAICWNFAFFALLAIAVPFAFHKVGLDAQSTGFMQAGYGLGLLAGAASAGRIVSRLEPRAVLIGGPALSVLAAGLLILAGRGGGFAPAFAGFFLAGFGPMLWLVCQTSIRQLVTPTALIGRVAATIQVAIYGVRPLGALAGGAIGSLYGLDAAMLAVLAGFALSLAVSLTSALGQLRAMPLQQGAPSPA